MVEEYLDMKTKVLRHLATQGNTRPTADTASHPKRLESPEGIDSRIFNLSTKKKVRR